MNPPLYVIMMTDKQILISGYELNGIMFTVHTVLQGYSIWLVSFFRALDAAGTDPVFDFDVGVVLEVTWRGPPIICLWLLIN